MKMITWFILQCISTIIISIVYIAEGGYADGEKAMAPMAVMIAVFIQFLISVVVFSLLKNKLQGNKRIVFFLFNMAIYELSFLLFSGSMPIFDIFENSLIGFISRGYSFSSLLSGVIFMVAFYASNMLYLKKIKDRDKIN